MRLRIAHKAKTDRVRNELLRTRREDMKPAKATGAQLHCSPMAPQQH
ncbi:hypothetical protein [Streptomyces sp. NPDC093094]